MLKYLIEKLPKMREQEWIIRQEDIKRFCEKLDEVMELVEYFVGEENLEKLNDFLEDCVKNIESFVVKGIKVMIVSGIGLAGFSCGWVIG